MKRVFISLPMNGRTDEEVESEINDIKEFLDIYIDEPYAVIASWLKNAPYRESPIACLAQSIDRLSMANLAVFGRNWAQARGCQIEHEICEKYGVDYIEVERLC